MDIIYLLAPISLIILAIAIGGFCWAVRSGQYDDLDRHAVEILLDDAKERQEQQQGRTQ